MIFHKNTFATSWVFSSVIYPKYTYRYPFIGFLSKIKCFTLQHRYQLISINDRTQLEGVQLKKYTITLYVYYLIYLSKTNWYTTIRSLSQTNVNCV